MVKLWARLHQFRVQSVQDPEHRGPKPMVECGAVTVIPRRNTEFFLSSGARLMPEMAPHVLLREELHQNRLHQPSEISSGDSNAETRQIYEFIKQLKHAGQLTPNDMVATFISRRVLPLQHRSHKICQMSGPLDPTRITTVELTNAEIRKKVKAIASTKMPVDWQWGMRPYDRQNLPPVVSADTDVSGIASAGIDFTGLTSC